MATTKKVTTKKAVPTAAKKTTAKKPATRTAKNDVVDFYPNRMGFAVASLAAVILVLLGLITMTN